MRLHHLALRTPSLDRLVGFYVWVIGLPVAADHRPRSVWLDAAGTLLMFEQADAGEPTVAAQSMELCAFAAAPGSKPEWLRRLGAVGARVEHSTRFTLYFRDPDGRRVAVSSYPEPIGGAADAGG